MKKRIVSTAQIAAFKVLLVSEEKSAATTEKYIRDVKAFAEYMQNNEITKESVLAYKKHIQQKNCQWGWTKQQICGRGN